MQHRVWIGVLRRNVDPAVVRIHRQPGHCAVRAETRIRAGVPLHRGTHLVTVEAFGHTVGHRLRHGGRPSTPPGRETLKRSGVLLIPISWPMYTSDTAHGQQDDGQHRCLGAITVDSIDGARPVVILQHVGGLRRRGKLWSNSVIVRANQSASYW